MAVSDTDTMFRLQRLEAMNTTDRVRGWVDEGMTVEDMGNPLTMEAFRERQADRPPEVPTNIERENSRSVQRSEKAASKTGPSGETGVPDPVREVISSTGRSLDASIQRAMEDRMGDSFGDVQVHTGPTAASACESINARAFTVGNHVAFNSGEYDPTSAEGQHVIAHELAHVTQQTGGAVSMLPQQDVELEIDPDPQLEREAEETAQRVMQGGELGIQRLADTEVHVQRMGPNNGTTSSSYLSGRQAGGGEGSGLMDKAKGVYESLAYAEDTSPDLEEFSDNADLQQQVDALKQNQQQLADQIGEAGAGNPNWAEMGTQETIKAIAQESLKQGGAAVAMSTLTSTILPAVGAAAALGLVLDFVSEKGSLVEGLKDYATKIPGVSSRKDEGRDKTDTKGYPEN